MAPASIAVPAGTRSNGLPTGPTLGQTKPLRGRVQMRPPEPGKLGPGMQRQRIFSGPAIYGDEAASTLRLVAASSVDANVRRDLYARIRSEEFAQLPFAREQLRNLLSQQFDLQERDYRDRFPRADLDSVQYRGIWIGRFYVDRTGDPMRVLDIGLPRSGVRWESAGHCSGRCSTRRTRWAGPCCCTLIAGVARPVFTRASDSGSPARTAHPPA